MSTSASLAPLPHFFLQNRPRPIPHTKSLKLVNFLRGSGVRSGNRLKLNWGKPHRLKLKSKTLPENPCCGSWFLPCPGHP